MEREMTEMMQSYISKYISISLNNFSQVHKHHFESFFTSLYELFKVHQRDDITTFTK